MAAPYIPEASFRQRQLATNRRCIRTLRESLFLLVGELGEDANLVAALELGTDSLERDDATCTRAGPVSSRECGTRRAGRPFTSEREDEEETGDSRYNDARGVSSVSNIDAQLTMLSSGASEEGVSGKGGGSRWEREVSGTGQI